MVKHSRRKSKLIRFLSVALCVCLMIPTMGATAADSLDEMRAQSEKLSQQKQQLEAESKRLDAEKAEKEEYQQNLNSQINVVVEEISNLEKEIDLLDKEIIKLEAKLEAAEAEMGDTLDEFYDRISALYMSGSSELTTLEVLLNAEDIHDLTLKLNVMDSINEHDSLLLEKIEEYSKKTEADRQEQKTRQEELANRKKDMDAKKTELDGLLEENSRVLSEIAEEKASKSQQIEDIEVDQAAIEDEIRETLRKFEEEQKRKAEERRKAQEQQQNQRDNTGGNPDNGFTPPETDGDYTPPADNGGWMWPISGTVTQYYSGGHPAYDISSGGNAPVYAAKSGTVADLESNWSPAMGTSNMASYGNYVYLYHDGTYSSRYAHLVTVVVSPGQYVSKGQLIGYEGNTGNSFGRHLHFEIWENGSRVNPGRFI